MRNLGGCRSVAVSAMAREPDNDKSSGYPAEKVRQGRIVLNTPARRAIFIGGLAAIVLLVLFLALAA